MSEEPKSFTSLLGAVCTVHYLDLFKRNESFEFF